MICSWYSDSGDIEIAELQAREELCGWYNRFHKPVVMTEFGADAIAGFHSDPPQMFSEEYQPKQAAQFLRKRRNGYIKPIWKD